MIANVAALDRDSKIAKFSYGQFAIVEATEAQSKSWIVLPSRFLVWDSPPLRLQWDHSTNRTHAERQQTLMDSQAKYSQTTPHHPPPIPYYRPAYRALWRCCRVEESYWPWDRQTVHAASTAV